MKKMFPSALFVFLLLCFAAHATPIETPSPHPGFVYVTDVVPDVLLEIRYYSTYNFTADRVDGYRAPTAILSKEAATALKNVSDALRGQGYVLKIFDAYRPQVAVDHFVRWATDVADTRLKSVFYPEVDKDKLFALGYWSSPRLNRTPCPSEEVGLEICPDLVLRSFPRSRW